MSDTDVDYLQPGFDPASLTVPRLRSIFVSHDIQYPSGAKKPQLIEIFNTQVVPRARKILADRAKVRRQSKGIIDAESSQESTVTGEEEEEDVMPPPRTPRQRVARKPSRMKSEESESDASSNVRATRKSSRMRSEESESDAKSTVRSPVKRTPRPSKHPRTSDTETGTDAEVRRTVRKTRKSEAPPVAPYAAITPKPIPEPKVKQEQMDDGSRVSRRVSNFTFDNPFQSGSSPPSEKSARKSLGSSKDKRRSQAVDGIAHRSAQLSKEEQDIHRPSSAKFEAPSSRRSLATREEHLKSIEPSEEFTPEAQIELAEEEATGGVVARRAPRQDRSFGAAIWSVLTVLLAGYAYWYRQEKLAVGYCGVGRDANQVIPANIAVPDWVTILVEPKCEPCPQHGYCTENLVTRCEHDFILKPHPLSLGGLIPFTPTCEPDGEKVRKVKAVADRAIQELRQRRAQSECGTLVDEKGLPAAVDIDAVELKTVISRERKKSMSEAEFEELWGGAIGEIENRDEVESRVDGLRQFLSSKSFARVPLKCTFKRYIRRSLERYRLPALAVVVLSLFLIYLRFLFKSHKTTQARIPQLVALTLERLATQVTLHVQDKETFPENWIAIGQLRDDVLRNEHSIKKREAIWSRVRNVVEMNANVRSRTGTSRSGEVSKAWEWIGALDDGKIRSRKSGRVSWGAYDENSSPVSGNDGGPKWEESRPIF